MATEDHPTKNFTITNGTTLSIHIPDHAQESNNTTSGDITSGDDYDAVGAMQFIVATVLVYSIFGVFCTLLTRFKRERGSGHLGYVQDEMVLKYIKHEKFLKLDGYRMKLLYDSQIVAEKVRIYEEKHRLIQLEKDLEADFSKQKVDPVSQNHKKSSKKKSNVGSTVGIMGMSLFHFNPTTDSECDSVKSTMSDIPVQGKVTTNGVDVSEQKESLCTEPAIESEPCETSVFLESDV